MWITLVTFILQMVNVTVAVVMNFTACGKAKTDASTLEKPPVNKRLRRQKLRSQKEVKKDETAKSDQNSERNDGCSLGADNPQIRMVITEVGGAQCTVILTKETYVTNLENILETASSYVWSMKKHMAADEAAWRELAKRITLLHAEGYDVRAGTKEAKLRRLTTAKLQSDLMNKVTKKKKRRVEDAAD